MKRRDIIRALWSSAAILAVAQTWYVLHHFERRIALAQSSVESLYAMTAANERTSQQGARLRAARDAAQRDLAQFRAPASLPAATAAVLRALERQARAHHATVTALSPAALPEVARTPGLLATPLTLRVRGRFRDLLGFLIDVAQRTPLVEVRRTQLARAQNTPTQKEPMLDAAIDATMYRFMTVAPHGEPRAAAR